MRRTLTLAVAFLFAALAGCGPNVAELAKALASDPATLKLDITSPWGSFHLDRSNPTAAQVPLQLVPVMQGAAPIPAK